jgi:hypothetical protein
MLARNLLVLLLFNINVCIGQQNDSTYAERLGYPKSARVLILHVDDAGMSFESNEGTISAITKGVANSCSVMMPCPWVPGFVKFLKQNPDIDAGLHLTLTSEWKNYRWVPLAGKISVPGLTDEEGCLWGGVADVVKHASADEVEKEIRAQIDRAESIGFKPTHFDSHMGTLFATPAFLERYIKVWIEKRIPVMLPGGHNILIQKQQKADDRRINQLRMLGRTLWSAGLPVLDDLHNESYGWKIESRIENDDKKLQAFKTQKYIKAIRSLKPGVTMMIMHCTATTPVFPNISDSGPLRKADLLAMLDPLLKKTLQQEGIILTTWRELKERRDKVK